MIYTPGDNEWSDCVDRVAGGYDPLDRLERLRRIFFDSPIRSLGGVRRPLESQSADHRYAEFVEHTRWTHSGVAFIAIDVVGTGNGRRDFDGREPRHEDEVRRRTDAAIAWLYDSYAPLHEALVELAQHFGKPTLVVHGDDHAYTVDRPFTDPVTGQPVSNLQRLQTFGSPDIGWVDVVVDTAVEEPFRFEPNVTPWWM